MKINFIDRAIAALWPERAVRRLAFKQTLARTYDIGLQGRRTSSWFAKGTSSNAEIGGVVSYARNRGRDLVRNNAYAASGVRKLTAKIVGTGIQPRIEGIKGEVRKDIMSDWNAFVENCDPAGMQDYYGIQSLAIRTIIECGEVLIVYDPQNSKSGLRIPLQIRVLEPDYIDHTKNIALKDGGAIIYGIEFDAVGRRVAYWLFDRHPGDSLIWGKNSLQSRRVEATYIDHVFDILRPGQARGITWFAPVALKMRDVADYEEAEIVRKKIEACTVAFVTRAAGTVESLTKGELQKENDGRQVESMSPGSFFYGRPGDDVKFNNPSSSQGYKENLTQQLYAVAAGIGIPFHVLTGDVSQANYSSSRVAAIDFNDLLDHWQWLMMVPMLCRKTWRRFDQFRAVSTGNYIEKSASVIWTPPQRPLIDPTKDAEAEKMQIRMGRKTLRQSIAETGNDPDDVLEEIAATNEKLDAHGLVLDSDPRRVQVSGKTQDTSQTDATDTTDATENKPARKRVKRKKEITDA